MQNVLFYQLIKQLTDKEKNHLTRLLGDKDSRTNSYYLVFKYLCEQEEFSYASMKAYFEHTFAIKNLHSVLHELYNKVLEGLLRVYEKDNPQAQVQNHIHHARLLENYGSFDLALEELDKAYDLAKTYDWPQALCDILIAKVRLHNFMSERQLSQTKPWLEELAWQRKRAVIEQNCDDTYYQLGYYYQTDTHSTEHQALIDGFLEKYPEIPADASFNAQVKYGLCQIFIALSKGQAENHLKWTQTVVDLWESNKKQQVLQKVDYCKALDRLLSMICTLERWEQLEDLLARAKAIPMVSLREKAILFQAVFKTELSYWINIQKPIAEVQRELQKGMEEMGKLEAFMDQGRLMSLKLSLALYYFTNQKYDDAVYHLDTMPQNKTVERSPGRQRTVIIMRLYCLYEQEIWEVLSNAIEAAKKRFTRWRQGLGDHQWQVDEMLLRNLNLLAKHASGPDPKKTKKTRHAFFDETLKMYAEIKYRDTNGLGLTLFWLASKDDELKPRVPE